MAGLRDLGSNWQGNGEDEHTRLVVLVDLLSHDDGFGSLCDDAQGWQPEGMRTFRIGS
jgi:hypothetical protein